MKNFKILVLTALLCTLLSVNAFAASVSVNGQTLPLTPVIQNGVSYVSVDEVCKFAGITLSYPNANTVVATQSQYKVSVTFALVNGSPTINNKKVSGTLLDVNGKLYVPVRTLAEGLGARVTWAAGQQTVEITASLN